MLILLITPLHLNFAYNSITLSPIYHVLVGENHLFSATITIEMDLPKNHLRHVILCNKDFKKKIYRFWLQDGKPL